MLAAFVSGCSSLPENASTTEFCTAFTEAITDPESAEALRRDTEAVREIGTPAAMSQSAEQGYVILTEALLREPQAAIDELRLSDLRVPFGGSSYNKLEVTNIDAFATYYEAECEE